MLEELGTLYRFSIQVDPDVYNAHTDLVDAYFDYVEENNLEPLNERLVRFDGRIGYEFTITD